jgi:DNA-binding response OmpR family regulator
VRCESVSPSEGLNFFLSLQSLDLFARPNPFQFGLKNRAGFFILEQLRNTPATQKTPVIILSSDASPTRIERMLKAGARDYLIKPFDIKRLLFLVDEALYSRSQIAA